MIKQIQLRGITRNPSDRQTPDGGCAESINAYLDENETGPAPMPKDVSRDVYGENTQSAACYQIKYIHKIPAGDEIYIGVKPPAGPVNTYILKGYKGGGTIEMSPSIPNEPKYFSSIGNTLMVYTDTKPYYFLFKDGSYISLGSEIPRPQVEFVTIPASSYIHSVYVEGDLANLSSDVKNTWNNAKNVGDPNHSALLKTMENLWIEAVKGIDTERNDKIFVAPFFIRYALKLYNGSYIYTSTPILCGGLKSRGIPIDIDEWLSTSYTYDIQVEYYRLRLEFSNTFKVRLKGEFNVGDWGDMVQSIDIFASTPIHSPLMYAGYSEMAETDSSQPPKYRIIFDGMNANDKDETIKTEILSKGQFYLIKSINIRNTADMAQLGSGEMEIENSPGVSGDELVTHTVMPEGYRDSSQYIPVSGVQNYNNRVMMLGAKEEIGRGDVFLNGQCRSTGEVSHNPPDDFEFRFKIVDSASGSQRYVLAHYKDGSTPLKDAYLAIYNEGSANENSILFHGDETPSTTPDRYYRFEPYSWLCFPDTRCTEVQVKARRWDSGQQAYSVRYGVFVLEPHPLLECAYAFFGYGESLYDQCTETTFDWQENENRELPLTNKIFLSEFENPFLFPAGGIITFNDDVVGAAMTSVALSEGQFGEFPLYVFTKGGIKVLATNSEGAFSAKITPPNMARHVALPGTIIGLEQSIVFTTEKGVMMLTGSSVQCISDLMNGRHWALDDGLPNVAADKLSTLISSWTGYSSISAALSDDKTFMEFMKQAKVAYDYNGKRLLFCKDSTGYFYVYMLETGTWHKMQSEETTRAILNSFPECLMASQGADGGVVYNYSTVLDKQSVLSDTGNVRYSLIVTRPLDLGEPDVRKAIKDLRVRGRYNDKADVKYILLGSMDGTSWRILSTLRGGSFKWFRIVLLCSLSPTERVTWIDVDYEPRFTNRLR